MQTLKRNYDRVAAVCLAAVCLFVSSALVMKSFAIGEKFAFEEIPPRSDVDFETGVTADLFARLEAAPQWEPPVGAHGRSRSAMVSAPVLYYDGELIEVYGGSPIRGEVPNPWLIENGLPIERSDVLLLDSDGDKFSNGEEYRLGQTDPRDAESHPDVLHKFRLAGVSSEDYILKFASGAGGKFNVRRVKTGSDSHWRDWFEIGDVLPGDRFTLIAGDAQSITIREVVGDGEIVLAKNVEKNLPIFAAEFSYLIESLPPAASRALRGDRFKLGRSGISCTVEAVAPEGVTVGIVRPGGKSERRVLKARK